MKTFNIQILACDRVFYAGEMESLIVPTSDGLHGIWADHLNTIGAIVPGMITYRIPGEEDKKAVVSGGMVKIEDNEVLLLIDSIEKPEEIDYNRAQRAAAQAKEEMLQKRSRQEYYMAEASLARAINRLKAKGRQK